MGHARALEELVAHDLVPEIVDLLVLREEPVATEVEAVAVGINDRLGDTADLVVGLEHDDLLARLGQQVPGGQPSRSTADHDVGMRGLGVRRRYGFGQARFVNKGHADSFPARAPNPVST